MGFRGQPSRGPHEQKGEGAMFSCRNQPLSPQAVCVWNERPCASGIALRGFSTEEPREANLDLLDWGDGCPGIPYSSLSFGGVC